MKLPEFVLFLLAAAFIQNVVLTTGFGSSIMLRIVRRPRDTFAFGGLLCFFTIFTTMLAYPVDLLIRSFSIAKLIRPVIMIAIAAALYIGVSFLLKKTLPSIYQSLSRLLPLAAFNNVVIGVALIVNHQFTLSFWGAVGLALGACVFRAAVLAHGRRNGAAGQSGYAAGIPGTARHPSVSGNPGNSPFGLHQRHYLDLMEEGRER